MQIDWWTLGLQTINFLVVVWLLSRFLYRPVRRIIDEREAADRKLSEEAQAKADEAEKAREAYEGKLAEFAEEQRRKEAELQRAMEGERDAALKDAREEADAMLSEARATLDREREDALSKLQSDIAGLAADLARKALVSGAGQNAALQQADAYFDGLSPKDLADLQHDIAEPGTQVTVVTAEPLGADMQSSWRTGLANRFGGQVTVSFSVDPSILGGADIHFPHAVLNLSVAQRLKDAVDGMKV